MNKTCFCWSLSNFVSLAKLFGPDEPPEQYSMLTIYTAGGFQLLQGFNLSLALEIFTPIIGGRKEGLKRLEPPFFTKGCRDNPKLPLGDSSNSIS